MIRQSYKILATEGLHARPAKALVKLLKSHNSQVFLQKGEQKGDAHSILQILSLCILYQDEITIEVNGEDEENTFCELNQFFTEDILTL